MCPFDFNWEALPLGRIFFSHSGLQNVVESGNEQPFRAGLQNGLFNLALRIVLIHKPVAQLCPHLG